MAVTTAPVRVPGTVVSPEPFVNVIRHARGTEKIGRENAAGILEGYLAAMERLVAYLNEYKG